MLYCVHQSWKTGWKKGFGALKHRLCYLCCTTCPFISLNIHYMARCYKFAVYAKSCEAWNHLFWLESDCNLRSTHTHHHNRAKGAFLKDRKLAAPSMNQQPAWETVRKFHFLLALMPRIDVQSKRPGIWKPPVQAPLVKTHSKGSLIFSDCVAVILSPNTPGNGDSGANWDTERM